MDAGLAAKKYTEVLGHRKSLKKTKPVDDTSLTLKRKMKFQNDLNANKPKLSLTLKPVNLITLEAS